MADPRRLLYTDFDGNALDTPAPLVGRGLVDDRHLERVPGLAAVVEDPTADPFDRLFACLALTAWGEERGYRAVARGVFDAAAVARPARSRAPFGLVAAQVGISDAMAERKGTEPARLDALRALIGVADREDFADQLGAAIFTGPAVRGGARTSSARHGGACNGWTGAPGRASTCRASSSTSSSRWWRWTSRPRSRW